MDVATSRESFMRRRLFPALFALVAAPASSNAVGLSTQLNCASDYYAYCSSHPVGSPGVRKCMRANGPRLSKGCINALIADGEISKTEVEQTKAKIAAEKVKAKPKKPDAETEQAQARAKKPERVIAQPKPSKAKTEAVARLNDDDRPITKPKVRDEPRPLPEAAIEPVKASPAQAEPPKTPSAAPAEPTQHVLTLDQETFEALKSREAYFVVEDDTSGVAASQQTAGAAGSARAPAPAESPSPAIAPVQDASLSDGAATQTAPAVESDERDPNAEAPRPSDTTQGIDRIEEPRTQSGGTYEPSSADNPSRAQTVRDDASEAATAPASPPTAKAPARKAAKPKPEYPAGKMALGRSESSAPAVRPVPDQSKAWQEFMGTRFNGGSNYEGIDASFSRRSR
jgi:hypothetical protein